MQPSSKRSVSALRHLRDSLPVDWNDQKRHKFLIHHLAGDEIEPFACEVAMLSLILADYPNHNGWHIKETDLFEEGVLEERMKMHNVILCNPPFEAFNKNDENRYSITKSTKQKPIAVLNAALNSHPLALGFLLPRSFIIGKKYAEQRRRIGELYSTIELVEVPEGTKAPSCW